MKKIKYLIPIVGLMFNACGKSENTPTHQPIEVFYSDGGSAITSNGIVASGGGEGGGSAVASTGAGTNFPAGTTTPLNGIRRLNLALRTCNPTVPFPADVGNPNYTDVQVEFKGAKGTMFAVYDAGDSEKVLSFNITYGASNTVTLSGFTPVYALDFLQNDLNGNPVRVLDPTVTLPVSGSITYTYTFDAEGNEVLRSTGTTDFLFCRLGSVLFSSVLYFR